MHAAPLLLAALACAPIDDARDGDAAEPAAAARPNVLFIVADDLGAGDLGCTGHPHARTPHLDRLAAGGTRFMRGSVSAGWCSPSRYALLSGRYPARAAAGKTNEKDRPTGDWPGFRLEPDAPCVTRAFQNAGYRVAHFGKWHLSGKTKTPQAPAEFGIDAAAVTSMNGQPRPAVFNQPHGREKSTDWYVDRTIEFVDAAAADGAPFYINLWVYPTHSYIDPTPEMLAEYADLEVKIEDFPHPQQREFLRFVARHGDVEEAVRAYCADVTAMDAALGRALDHLEQTGLAENTLVVFTSDNGPGPLAGTFGALPRRYAERPTLLNSVGTTGGLRERKVSLYEGGVRVPWIVRHPGRVPAGRVDDATLLTGVDWFPSVLAHAGLGDAGLGDGNAGSVDGADFSPAWRGEIDNPAGAGRERAIYWNDLKNWDAVRRGDWKLHRKRGAWELYDLAADPGETRDQSAARPDVLAELKADRAALRGRVGLTKE